MAEPLKFAPKAPPIDSARGELEQLLEVLHRSGALRTLRGLLGSLPQITETALEQAEGPSGRRLVTNAAIAVTSLTELDYRVTHQLIQGLVEGTTRAARLTGRVPPGFFSLLRALSSDDARRGLWALVTVLQSMGRRLAADDRATDGTSE